MATKFLQNKMYISHCQSTFTVNLTPGEYNFAINLIPLKKTLCPLFMDEVQLLQA